MVWWQRPWFLWWLSIDLFSTEWEPILVLRRGSCQPFCLSDLCTNVASLGIPITFGLLKCPFRSLKAKIQLHLIIDTMSLGSNPYWLLSYSIWQIEWGPSSKLLKTLIWNILFTLEHPRQIDPRSYTLETTKLAVWTTAALNGYFGK